jgi:hypothetical protein
LAQVEDELERLEEKYKRYRLELEAELERSSVSPNNTTYENQVDALTHTPMARATILVDENRKRKRPMEEMTSRYSFTFTPRKTLMSCRPETEGYSTRIRIITVWEI